MTFSCPELTLDQVLALANKFGYDGIEPRVSSNHKHGVEFDSSPAFRKEARQKAEAAGIQMACVATSCVYADPAKTTVMIEDTHQAIDLAGDIGAPCIRVFGGTIPESVSREQAIDGVAKALASVADHAQQRQVIVGMETHDAWCDPAHVAAVIQQVNHPAIGVNWDIMHPVRVARVTMDQTFNVLKPWIRHVHFHDCKITDKKYALCPIGQGDIDHHRAVQLLKSMAYSNFLSGEWIGWEPEPYATHLPRELATMKGYEREE